VKQVLVQAGKAVVEEVPVPMLKEGTALIRTVYSCISVGTEMHGMRLSGEPLWKRALREPAKARKALSMIANEGVATTWNRIASKVDALQVTGYSAAGIVVDVGPAIDDLAPGMRVACAGAQCAHHAELIAVPRNLIVPLDDSVDIKHASSVALGAIALQGVRRAQPTLGETFVIVGLGIIGQLTAQLLRLNGCKTIGIDLQTSRVESAKQLGLHYAVESSDSEWEQVARLTDGYGADGVIITAASPSDAIVANAFRMCRKKGRVVVVGDVGLDLNRADFYEKEIDFLISASYGPGRYDRGYEEANLDYPLPYVRWTENRNMAEYIRLLADKSLDIAPLATAEYPLARATDAYADLGRPGGQAPIVAFLSYPHTASLDTARTITNPRARAAGTGGVSLAIIGAGEFATASVLPNVRKLSNLYRLHAIVDASGARALNVARQFGAQLASSEYEEILADPRVDAVYIATRHASHAQLVLAALRAGKHVLVEKPLALTRAELADLEAFVAAATDHGPVLLAGFNRRFSPYARRLAELLRGQHPMLLSYRMNAGHIPASSWVHGVDGGGRNLGEACHIYDLFTFLTGARAVRIEATAVPPARAGGTRDNFATTIAFDDGSVASLLYTALGTAEFPKETLEVYCGSAVHRLSDYRCLETFGLKAAGLTTKLAEKGHNEELVAFARCIQDGGEWPIPMWQLAQATRIALDVEDAITRSLTKPTRE
jgi:predicted dehydrogenase/threonine dehydrogenase-like Zn-dependent dehydrogenase